MAKHSELDIICNGCGNLMRRMGEWPVQFPRVEKPKNMQQSSYYICETETCRIPTEGYSKGALRGISIIEGVA